MVRRELTTGEHFVAGAGSAPELGRVHPRLVDLEQAVSFYADTLSFAVTA